VFFIAHSGGRFGRRLQQLAKVDVLILDDWALASLDENARHDLLEVIDDRAGSRSTVLTSQLPVDHWHGWINDPTVADALAKAFSSKSPNALTSLRVKRLSFSKRSAVYSFGFSSDFVDEKMSVHYGLFQQKGAVVCLGPVS